MICWLSQGTRSDSSHKGTCVVCFHLGVTSWQILSDGKPDTIHVGFFAYSLLTQYHLHYVKHRSSSCTKQTGHWSSFCLQASPLLGGSVSPAPPLPRVNVTEEQRAQLSVPIVIKGLRCPGPGKGTNPGSWESPSISLYQERVFFLPWPPLFFIHIPWLAQSWNFLVKPDMEQQIGSKLAKEYVKAIYCHPVYLTYMQSTSCEMPGLINTSWNQDCWEKYQ